MHRILVPTLALAVGAIVCPAYAETSANELPPPPVPLSSLELDAETSERSIYQFFWSSSDLEIERNDLPRWSQSDFATNTPGFVAMKQHEANAASWNGLAAAQMAQKREDVAKRIWDQRLLTTANHAYGRLRQKSKAVGRADAAMNALGNASISFPSRRAATAAPAPRTPGSTGGAVATVAPAPAAAPIQFRYGYMLLNDAAFFSLRQQGSFDLSLRRFRFVTASMNGGFADAPTFLSFRKDLGLGLPTPTLTYAVHAPSLELAVAQTLSPFTDFSISGSHDFVLDANRLYFTLAYRF